MEMMLTGIDGKNPLGFLAALGTLNALTDHAKSVQPKLAWKNLGTYRPVVIDGPERAALLDILVQDQEEFTKEEALALRYQKASSGADAHDLKPPPEDFSRYLRKLVEADARRSMRFAASFATDVVRDNSGNTKPTALHFTAGQQEFLGMVSHLQKGVTRNDLEEALFGPWTYSRPLPVLQWDNSQSRDYALRANDPSKEKKLGVPGADWLAFRGLPFLPTAPTRRRGEPTISTTGCQGSWKGGTFRWPIWSDPLSARVIRSLLTSPELFESDARTLRARGIPVVFESAIGRSDQGGYGSFAPARVAERSPANR